MFSNTPKLLEPKKCMRAINYSCLLPFSLMKDKEERNKIAIDYCIYICMFNDNGKCWCPV